MSAADASTAAPKSDLLPRIAFVLIWGAGYAAAAFALAGMGPFTLASLRFVGSAAIIGVLILMRRAARPSLHLALHAALAGLLLQAGFFGFTYAGLRAGVSPAVAGLIAGLMPLTTALGAAPLLGERMRPAALVGLALGLAGVLLVIAPGLQGGGPVLGYVFVALALASLSLGTLYQKRWVVDADPVWSMLIQLLVSALALLPFGWLLEGLRVQPSVASIGGLAWVTLVNSAAGLLLYLSLLAHSGAARVASLFYLVPPVAAAFAAVLLHAHFGPLELLGFGLAALGVWLGQRS
jgi:drug/metabolite transporter (DMT)-like permease